MEGVGMTQSNREKWLILDDSASDRRRLATALADLEAQVELIQAATVAESQDILAKDSISLCLFDFFLRGTTTERLIANIRASHPEIPIVVVSGQAGSEKRIYNAGADSVVPKVLDARAFATMVKSAVLHAKELRHMKAGRVQFRRIYLSPEVTTRFRQILRRGTGNVLITSPAGMGRTDVARSLAERIRSRSPQSHGREVMTLACTNPESPLTFDELLFGKPKDGRLPHRGLLEAAQDAVLVIDDAHLLPEEVQERMKALFKQGHGISNTGATITTSRLRIVFTALDNKDACGSVQGFMQNCIAFFIEIPAFSRILDEKKAIVEFAFKRASRKHRQKVKADRGLLRTLCRAIDHASHRVTMRSIVRTVEDAVARANEDGRTLVVESDLGNLEFLYEAELQTEPTEISQLTMASDDKIGAEPWHELYHAARNNSFEEATDLLRKMMVEYAMIKHKGNKTKVAAQLNVARQHLYKPCLRDLVLTDNCSQK
jgi:DNA-binding NtrC family response regulator